tara:strand:+ start:1784 stop:2020 length:237 start_codon:yes stop_codon:yes gene_type:complete
MRAADRRINAAHARHAEAIWVGLHADQSELNRFMKMVTGASDQMPPEALSGMLHAASAGLDVISMADYVKGNTKNGAK